MATIQLNQYDFGTLLRQQTRLDIDLQNATLLELLRAYQKHTDIKGKRTNLSPLVYNIEILERDYQVKVMPEQVTDVFYAHFVRFLTIRGVLPSTINNYCSTLKAALNWGKKHNGRVSSTYDEFRSTRFSRIQVALTPDEVSHIYHFDIDTLKCRADKKRTLRRVRDMFVLSCNLGQRYSDMVRVVPTCFNEDKTTFTICQQKTGTKAKVNLSEMTIDKSVTREILERYNWSSPYNGDISNYDHYLHGLLKDIGKGFESKTVVDEGKMLGEMHRTETPLYKKVSSHTARRTFISYHIIRGVHEARVRRCSGHTDSRSFAKYIIFDDD